MLDRDLARLSVASPDVSLTGLEQAIWSRVETLKRFRRFGRITSRLQVLALGGALIASMAVGAGIAQPLGDRQAVLQISDVAADLAPSTLLGAGR